MGKQRLLVVHGMGADAVGLVGKIAAPIAQAQGNIVDLRQDVLHGLFTFHMVVDLTGSRLDVAEFEKLLAEIGEETGLSVSADPYSPAPRSPDKSELLVILIGRDKPGIIATSAEMLGKYNANIEFAKTIGREGVFLMELLTDVSHASIPVENLCRTVRQNMAAMDIEAMFQKEHVFIKRKRILLFHLMSSFLVPDVVDEIVTQTGLDAGEAAAARSGQPRLPLLAQAAARLDGLPLDAVDAILQGVTPTAGSVELIQTLKVMGYKIALVSPAFSFVTDYLRRRIDLDYAFGTPIEVDDDERALGGEIVTDELGSHDVDAVRSHLLATEGVEPDDVTTLTDEGCEQPPGIRLTLDLDVLLRAFNERVVSKEDMLGLLGSFGVSCRG